MVCQKKQARGGMKLRGGPRGGGDERPVEHKFHAEKEKKRTPPSGGTKCLAGRGIGYVPSEDRPFVQLAANHALLGRGMDEGMGRLALQKTTATLPKYPKGDQLVWWGQEQSQPTANFPKQRPNPEGSRRRKGGPPCICGGERKWLTGYQATRRGGEGACPQNLRPERGGD